MAPIDDDVPLELPATDEETPEVGLDDAEVESNVLEEVVEAIVELETVLRSLVEMLELDEVSTVVEEEDVSIVMLGVFVLLDEGIVLEV